MNLKSFDRVADVYDETRGLPPDVAATIAEALLAIFRSVAPQPRIVEVGIGTGRMAVPLAEAGVRVTGIDISPAMLSVLRGKRTDIDVMLAESARPPLQAGSFDGALFVHILHLVPDAAATVAATLALVREGGVLVVAGDDPATVVERSSVAIVRDTIREVAGVSMGDGVSEHERLQATFERAVHPAGAATERRRLAAWIASTTPRIQLERLARRDYSASWQIPDDALPDVVALVETRLTAEYGGDLDRELPFERTFSAVIARLPG